MNPLKVWDAIGYAGCIQPVTKGFKGVLFIRDDWNVNYLDETGDFSNRDDALEALLNLMVEKFKEKKRNEEIVVNPIIDVCL